MVDAWNRGPLVAFDLETTGVDPMTARIVTATVLVIPEDRQRIEIHEWLVDPGIPIPMDASKIHGITTEKSRLDGVASIEALPGILAEITTHPGYPLIVFNAAYDLTVLTHEWWRHFGSAIELEVPVIDPLVIDRAMDRYRKGKRTLQVMCEQYGVTLSDEDAHTSSGDALATARLAWKISKVYPEIGSAELLDLHNLQKRWYAEHSISFAEYLMTQARGCESEVEASDLQKRASSVNSDWPYQPLEVQSG